MPTIKQRINITADSALESALRIIAKRDKMSISAKVVELVLLGLGLEEDIALTQIADLRTNKPFKYIPHDSAWK